VEAGEYTKSTSKAIKSIKWSYLSQFLPKLAMPVSALILARLLTPSDYGLVASSTVITSIGLLLSSGGIAESIIQVTSDELKHSINILFWGNLLLAIILYTLVFFGAASIATYFNEPRLNLVLKIHGLSIIFNSASVIHTGLLRRNFEFKKFTVLSIIPVIVAFGITIPLASMHYGYWALVIGNISASFISLLLYIYFSKYIPSFYFDLKKSIRPFKFGFIVLLEGILGWIIMQADNAFVAKNLSIHDLGLYSFAKTFIAMAFGLLLSPIFAIIYSYLSRVNEFAAEDLSIKISKIIRVLSMVVFPMIIFTIILAPSAFPFLFSSKWNGSIILVQIIAVSQISYIFMVFPESFKAIGKPKILLPLNIIQTAFTLIVYYIAVRYGLIIFSLALLSLSWIFFFQIILASKFLNYKTFLADVRIYFFIDLALLGILAGINFLITEHTGNFLRLLILGLFGLGLYYLLIRIFAKKDIRLILDLVKKL
jgi:O-antigen/teichoic acid export membrane protein